MTLFARRVRALLLAAAAVTIAAQAAQAQQYYTGDGGKGIRVAVLEPVGKGLSAEEQWMLSLVQGSITGDFNKYSAMTVIDRQNLEKVLKEWEESMSGNYDEANLVKIGNLTSASHILSGSISKTANAFMLELSVADVASGERKASYSPTPISPIALENLSAIKAASADLLRQLGVELTGAAQGELRQAANTARIQAEAALARGIAAQRQGTSVAALSYFFQAAAFDSSLFEASKRSSVMAADISSGNIGADVRNDIAWRKSWVARLTETEATFHSIINTIDPPYTLFYAPDIKTGKINYQKESADLSIPINLSANLSWFNAMNKALGAADAVLNGLNTTNRKKDWGLARWPLDGVSGTNPFASSKRYDIAPAFELVNEQGRVIGSQTVKLTPAFKITRDRSDRFAVEFTENTSSAVIFSGVKADDISDNLSVRIASINGEPPQNARFAINAISAQKREQNMFLRIENGVVLGFDRSLSSAQKEKYRNLVIPKEAWGKPVTAIGDRAFAGEQIAGVTIPNGVTSIGKEAFASNCLGLGVRRKCVTLTKATVPGSVVSIGRNAFSGNELAVTIPNGEAVIENWQGLPPRSRAVKGPNNGAIIDARNDKIYRTVKISGKTWMAENLNYKLSNSIPLQLKECYDGKESNCEKYGRLYDYSAAKGACPVGWHLATRQEWDALVDAAGGKKTAGLKLKSNSWNGTDDFGFSALPGGMRMEGKSSLGGIDGYWWTATSSGTAGGNAWAYSRSMGSTLAKRVGETDSNQGIGISVRCVQD
ncbi:MAG: leucine-rich repeat protein [Chitinispirillales bacterium]|jgi:uncharacterized protein (TIGR02145 family)|nr:leucine-rich repeat protein [Chitinispirillales bacterium]